MQINFNPSGTFSQTSPIPSFRLLSPYLSPLIDTSHQQHSFNQTDLSPFQLEYQDHSSILNPLIDDGLVSLDGLMEEKDDDQIKEGERKRIKVDGQLKGKKRCQSIKSERGCCESKIEEMVLFLVQNSQMSEKFLLQEGKLLYQSSNEMFETFCILVSKFKKLKKTKEQMTKYCMRKAFKFITDKEGKDKKKSKDIDTCIKKYFETSASNITIPFKKSSSEKTMNGSFLKKVFSQPQFVSDYVEFLQHFPAFVVQDNEKKINYLVEVVEEYMNSSNIKKIENIKRLPWSRAILEKTSELSRNLLSYASNVEIHS